VGLFYADSIFETALDSSCFPNEATLSSFILTNNFLLMKNVYLSLFALFFSVSGFAQTFNYDFSVYTSDYVDLTEANLAIDYSWDNPQIAIPLGFSFSFEGLVNDTIYISEYGAGGLLVMEPLADPIDFLFAYTSDLMDAGYESGEYLSPISYKTSGEPGNQVCKIEWKDAGFYNEVSTGEVPTNFVSFQLWLYEGSNDFEIHYGPHTIKDFDLVHNNWLSAGIIQDIGLFDGGFAYGHVVSGQPATAAIVSSSEEVILISSGLYDNPSNGTVFRFGSNFVNVNEAEEATAWSAYPSPTNGRLTIQTGTNTAVDFNVFDLSGRVLASGQVYSQQNINVAEFETGIYLLRMTQGDNIETIQFVKH